MDKYIEIIEKDDIINSIKPYIKGKQAYIVGGYVRDILTGKHSLDRDLIICTPNIKEFSKNLADALNGYFIELDSINKIYRIVLADKTNYLDITVPVNDSLEDDLKRRDLTINAIAYDINNKKFIDLTGGIDDIQNKKIRGISKKNFEDDPLRLLRIYRFYAQTGFEPDENLDKIVEELKETIKAPAKERITNELLKLFEGKFADKALLKLNESGLLEEILPIYKEVKKIPPNSHHHLDLVHHLIETVNQIQLIYENSEQEVKSYLEKQKYGAVQELAMLKFAGFLHDIGKPSCWTIEEDTGRHRFIKHDSIGAELAVPILKDLKFSKKQIEYVKNLIKYHIYPSGMISAPDVTDKAILKFYRKTEGYVIDLIILAMADRLSAQGVQVTKEMVEENINNLTNLLKNYLQMKKDIKPIEKLLDGNDIMELTGIKRGPELGKIVNALKEAQIASEVTTKKEAEEFVRKFSQTIT